MKKKIHIKDKIDLEKIRLSGQAFRIRKSPEGSYRFICGGEVLDIIPEDLHTLSISCDEDKWREVWVPYFDLERSYDDIIKKSYGRHPYIDKAIDCGRGLRILKQNPWEMLITFIISQRKSIPAIASAVEAICKKYGSVSPADEGLYLFPTPEQMANANGEELSKCGLGYRVAYVLDAIERVYHREIDLKALYTLDDDELLKELLEIKGVGIKVANCVALFAYGRMGCVPVDVHIANAIEKDCGGESPFSLFGDDAGIIQQYVFYHQKHRGEPG
ncbi:MAG: DNA glycosylase [Lachnospiraceae bacterium]|nr:DNA glycosylase [Lachnospiraceae bacterium]